MSKEIETLHDRVEACRRHLTTAELSPEVRGELLDLLTDLDDRLASRTSSTSKMPAKGTELPASQSPLERLKGFERSVEATHPVLCGLVGNLADALSRMGV